jgi:hypothetical protein
MVRDLVCWYLVGIISPLIIVHASQVLGPIWLFAVHVFILYGQVQHSP